MQSPDNTNPQRCPYYVCDYHDNTLYVKGGYEVGGKSFLFDTVVPHIVRNEEGCEEGHEEEKNIDAGF